MVKDVQKIVASHVGTFLHSRYLYNNTRLDYIGKLSQRDGEGGRLYYFRKPLLGKIKFEASYRH